MTYKLQIAVIRRSRTFVTRIVSVEFATSADIVCGRTVEPETLENHELVLSTQTTVTSKMCILT